MLPIALALRPGVNTQMTPYQVGQGLVDSNLIRHRAGQIQKLGGCQRISSARFSGICRSLLPWQDLLGVQYLAIGTNAMLQLFSAGQIYTISPISHTSNLTTAFTTTAASSIITVTDGGHSPPVGSWFTIVNQTVAGGIPLQGLFQVLTSPGGTFTFDCGVPAVSSQSGVGVTALYTTTMGQATVGLTFPGSGFAYTTTGQTFAAGVSTTVGGLTFLGNYPVTVTAGPTITITASGNAGSSTTGSENSGNTRIYYYLALPVEAAAVGGFGVGPFGAGPFGVGTNAGTSPEEGAEPNVLALVEWSLDKWGQNLIAAYYGSTLYQWVPPIAAGNSAAAVAGAPSAMNGVFVAAPQQQAMAWGVYSATLGAQDPLLMGWSDVADLSVWTAATNNQAGTFRLSSGSLIVSATWFGLIGVVWTDVDVWQMSYVNYPLVYGFNRMAPNCGLAARRAWASLGNRIVWLSQNDFFLYQGGSVLPIECPVRDFIFNSLDTQYLENVHADPNTYGDEVTFWFPQIGSNGTCTGAVKVHFVNGLPAEWDIIQSGLQVSAWCDQSVLGPPIGSFYSGLLEQFETSSDFDGSPLDSFFLSGFFQIAEAEEIIFVERVYPDITLTGNAPSVLLTFYFADDLASAENPALVRTYGPYTVTPATEYLIVRGRGRVMQVRLDCTTGGTFWRYGKPPATISLDGRK